MYVWQDWWFKHKRLRPQDPTDRTLYGVWVSVPDNKGREQTSFTWTLFQSDKCSLGYCFLRRELTMETKTGQWSIKTGQIKEPQRQSQTHRNTPEFNNYIQWQQEIQITKVRPTYNEWIASEMFKYTTMNIKCIYLHVSGVSFISIKLQLPFLFPSVGGSKILTMFTFHIIPRFSSGSQQRVGGSFKVLSWFSV